MLQAGGWNYVWDYLNRLLASGYNNSTTTYAYDPSGARVLQTSTTSTTYYPNKYYSLTSNTTGSNTYATSTNYIWNGDTLLATVDQPLYNGAATGTAITRYNHPDHLGSTNVVTDASGTVAQLLDYYPYGATRIATSTYPTNEKRQYIGQFSDAQTNLNYLNARYYSPTQGQFLSEDPVFWGKQNIADPQSFNTYSYANDNPIIQKDPTGREVYTAASRVFPFTDAFYHTYYVIIPDSHSEFTNIGPFRLESGPNYLGPIPDIRRNETFFTPISSTAPNNGLPSDPNLYTRIYPHSGQSEDDLIKDLYRGHVAFGDMETWYSPFGNTGNLNGTNCNNYANTLAQFAGIVNQYTSFASRFNAPGSNNGLIGSAKTANIVDAFNASSKSSSNESKLWVTPNGAVITWGGIVVSGSKSGK